MRARASTTPPTSGSWWPGRSRSDGARPRTSRRTCASPSTTRATSWARRWHTSTWARGTNLAYSGDIKFERSWLFNPAANRFPRLETLILESTYGGYRDVQPSRQQATEEFSALAAKVVGRGGKLIVPVFAVGRSQEVMLVLEEKMREGKIPKVPVYLDGMIFEATAIHTAYPEYLNSQLRTQIFQQGDNPFLSDVFHRIDSSSMRYDVLDSKEPCIVLATSGMMSGGPVMEY